MFEKDRIQFVYPMDTLIDIMFNEIIPIGQRYII